jgi:hypothetical protein
MARSEKIQYAAMVSLRRGQVADLGLWLVGERRRVQGAGQVFAAAQPQGWHLLSGPDGHHDRVVPAHSFKYAAAAQAAQPGSAPILIRIDTKAGHGAGKPTGKQIEEVADRWGSCRGNCR